MNAYTAQTQPELKQQVLEASYQISPMSQVSGAGTWSIEALFASRGVSNAYTGKVDFSSAVVLPPAICRSAWEVGRLTENTSAHAATLEPYHHACVKARHSKADIPEKVGNPSSGEDRLINN